MNDYLTEFEKLANHIVGLTPPFLLSCFISCLNLDLHREVQPSLPMSLPQAAALTKLQEDKLNDYHHLICLAPYLFTLATI